ncbi:hypothetical protein BV22DRAFT_1128833 [Leucogyrophana mollusca]|uniref:Uncharacterized protein n=1 Tax=Leucogyrophana mollusca TaxID=85980 RepID=A0ACB8BIP6_9AGAM|nr:hypothetical protein BV22DRAFT_1128833 [Leucogyrophana mollusca]
MQNPPVPRPSRRRLLKQALELASETAERERLGQASCAIQGYGRTVVLLNELIVQLRGTEGQESTLGRLRALSRMYARRVMMLRKMHAAGTAASKQRGVASSDFESSSILQMEGTAIDGSPHQPTIADIIQVKDIFRRIPKPLPVELIDLIIDDASYWPHSSITLDQTRTVPDPRHRKAKDEMYMRTLPLAVPGVEGHISLMGREVEDGAAVKAFVLGMDEGGESYGGRWLPPRGEHPCKKIVFQLWSKGQGHAHDPTNEGSYRGSYTWFDAGVETPLSAITLDHSVSWPVYLITAASGSAHLAWSPFEFAGRDEHPSLPLPTHLQRNVHGKREVHHHTVVWHYLDHVERGSPEAVEAEVKGQGWKSLDGGFVRGLKVGDCITLWMRARFPARVMKASKAKIDVYWAV